MGSWVASLRSSMAKDLLEGTMAAGMYVGCGVLGCEVWVVGCAVCGVRYAVCGVRCGCGWCLVLPLPDGDGGCCREGRIE